MNKNILLISQGSTFMVDAISKNLKEVGFTIINCTPTVKDLKQHESDADIFLFYLGSFLDEIKDALVYLKDICIEKEKILNVVEEYCHCTPDYDYDYKAAAGIPIRPENYPLISQKVESTKYIRRIYLGGKKR